MSTPRRNEPCPCGSGKKYKKCHSSLSANGQEERLDASQGIEQSYLREVKALEAQREKQQGLGRRIVSGAWNDTRFVAVGKTLHYSKNWKTFHDFLRHFFLDSLGRDWLSAQATLPPEQQHIVLRWHDRAMQNLLQGGKRVGEVHSARMTGAARAFLNLAYNLYLIAHQDATEVQLNPGPGPRPHQSRAASRYSLKAETLRRVGRVALRRFGDGVYSYYSRKQIIIVLLAIVC